MVFDRLQRTPLGDLHARLSLARTSLAYSQTEEGRASALAEIKKITAEFLRRGYPVAA